MLLRLPVDVSDFSVLREAGYLYVDKTKYAYDLITGGRRYFLSRPRRFGKSLMVSTLNEIFNCNKKLFNSLWLAQSDYHWQAYGVINLDFSRFSSQNAAKFEIGLIDCLIKIAKSYQVEIDSSTGELGIIFENLVLALREKYGRVAIIIDEYDRPLVHNLHTLKIAVALRYVMQDFFATIKSHDKKIDFVFITGVSAFSKSGLFSGLNNLQNLTLDTQYAAICGYTDAEIDRYFHDYINLWAQQKKLTSLAIRQELKNWYNGYRFSVSVETVYNPFSLTNAFNMQDCKNFWLQTGTPTFLISELKQVYRKLEYRLLDPESFEVTEDSLGLFDIEAVPLPALMFQTGYLTISHYDSRREAYSLCYPNQEVRRSAQNYLLAVFTLSDPNILKTTVLKLETALNNQELDLAIDLLKIIFAKVPYPLHIPLESFYHSLLQMVLVTSGIKSQAEYNTSHGSIDLVLDLPNIIYVVEIKFNKTAELALAQIDHKRYYEPLLDNNKPIILLGINFQKTTGKFEITYAFKRL